MVDLGQVVTLQLLEVAPDHADAADVLRTCAAVSGYAPQADTRDGRNKGERKKVKKNSHQSPLTRYISTRISKS